MASEAPDPNTFSTWEDAFAYPIPVVRGMEKQLRREVDSNGDKLRTLVGASYRDLLGTADSIIKMDGKMQDVEALMGEIGRRCDSRLVERKARNLKRWKTDVESKDREKKGWISQMSVLRNCPDVIGSLLKERGGTEQEGSGTGEGGAVGGGRMLVAAKVLVLSRLLHTKLSKREEAPAYLEVLRNRLASLRRRLLGKIDQRFKSLGRSKEELVEGMCAFALATSSSAGDVVKHFHHLRLEAMGDFMSESTRQKEDAVLQALKLYVHTLRDTKAMVPSQLAASLSGLKSMPLFKSKDLVSLMELNLDMHGPWIGDDIKGFTPYIRHDDLTRTETEKIVKSWARTAIQAFSDGLKAHIGHIEDPHHVMQCRRQLLELWLGQHHHGAGIDAVEVLDGMRDIFNNQMTTLIRKQSQSLQGVGLLIKDVIEDWHPGMSDVLMPLWSSTMTSMDTTHGAKAFRSRIVDLTAGKNEILQAVLKAYTLWLKSIEGAEREIEEAKNIKWDDNLEDADDMDDLLDDKQVLLSQDDPGLLVDTLREGLAAAFERLDEQLSDAASDLQAEHQGLQAVYLLRVLREIWMRCPACHPSTTLGANLIPDLLKRLALSASQKPFETCSKRLDKFSRTTTFAARTLWEGDPEVPILPSPWAYRLLLELTQSMAKHGADIWSADAVKALKGEAMIRLAEVLEQTNEVAMPVMNGVTNGDHVPEAPVNGDEASSSLAEQEEKEQADADKDEKPPERDDTVDIMRGNIGMANGGDDSPPNLELLKEKRIQKLFDVLYLDNALAVADPSASNKDLKIVQSSLIDAIEMEGKAIERMKKGAAEYWKRTSLLFGLLA